MTPGEGSSVDPTARFLTLVQRPEAEVPLDLLALLIAEHATPALDVGRYLDRLDELATALTDRTFPGLVRHLADVEGFRGNVADYYDPRNSFLDAVIDRRVGIPITLGIVVIEVGRRAGVPVVGIGLPGHFLVREAIDEDVYADPFTGRLLDRDGCRLLFAENQGQMRFENTYLAPVSTRETIARVLGNLKAIYGARRDRRNLAWVLRLRAAVPGVPLEERRELASTLAADGRFLDGAAVLDELAALARARGADHLVEEAEQGATRLRARLN